MLMQENGAVLKHGLEGWSWIDWFLIIVLTLTTIKYGDFVPTTPLTKLVTILFWLNNVILVVLSDLILTKQDGRWISSRMVTSHPTNK